MTTTGRQQRQTTATAKIRKPNLSKWYGRSLPPIHPGDFEFLLDLLRPRKAAFPLQNMVDTFTWNDEQSALSGAITAYRPRGMEPVTLPISRGDLIRCSVRWGSQQYRLWTMRAQPVQTESEIAQLSVSLKDDLALLDSSALDWFFRKSKAKPHGYTADEITLAVARKLGVRVRKLAKGNHRFALVKRHVSGLAVLKAAWAQEKAVSGVGYVIRIRDGELEVVPIRRNPLLYVLGPQIQTALITQKNGSKVPTTVLEGRAHMGSGKTARKLHFTYFNRQVVQTLGYVHHQRDYGRLSSHAELRAKVKADYAKGIRLNDTITIQHAGIPFIQRGDGVEVNLPWEGYKGSQSYVYATRATHTVQAATYQSEWDFTLTDPYLAELEAEAKAAAARAKKRQQRNRSKLHA